MLNLDCLLYFGRYLVPDPVPWYLSPLMPLAKMMLLTAEQGARTTIYLATSDEVQAVSGKYFDKCKPATTTTEAQDMQKAKELWDLSLKLVKVDDPLPNA